MKPSTPSTIILLATAILLLSFIVPKGWQKSGTAEDKYEMGLWKVGGHDSSKACGVIRSTKKVYDNGEHGSLIQKVSSQKYLGKRLKMTGYMKGRGVNGKACFFIRADRDDDTKPLAYAYMKENAIRGNKDWAQYTLEVDVPYNSSKITFGALLDGEGQVWFDDITLEIIGNSTIAADYVMCDTTLKREPENLNFEQ
jgi:hypothetical protein